MTIHWNSVEQYFTVVLLAVFLFFNFTQFIILENISVLDFALSGLNGLRLLKVSSHIMMLHASKDWTWHDKL